MKTVIFVGPSLPEAQVKEILPKALVMPPAEQGDIDFARYQLGADVIGLIDGCHTMVLPPLHKEILSVLHDGCRVIGAASMGALRAVECEDFGAEPVGEVAQWYKDGEIDGDDEVCLVHGDRDAGFKHLSIPMVNIRATLKAADIDDEIKKYIIDCASNLFYPDRTWGTILKACDIDDTDTRIAIQSSITDIKEADSLHLCYHIANGSKAPAAKKKIENAHYGFAAAFENNDRKVLHEGKVFRKYQIAQGASTYDRMNSRNRAMALELCKILGISTDLTINYEYPDLTDEESIALTNEEWTLSRVGDWIACRANGSDTVKLLSDFLRISGRYNQIKESIYGQQ